MRPVEERLRIAKEKRAGCETRLQKLEVKSALLAEKEGRTRNQLARWDVRITKLETQGGNHGNAQMP